MTVKETDLVEYLQELFGGSQSDYYSNKGWLNIARDILDTFTNGDK